MLYFILNVFLIYEFIYQDNFSGTIVNVLIIYIAESLVNVYQIE